MDTGTMYELLCDSMDNLYAFALSRLGNTVLAEDLASEIILQIIKSHKSIKNDDAFFGFMWAVANNTYKKYLRQQKHEVSYNCNFMGIHYETPENIIEDSEQIILIRNWEEIGGVPKWPDGSEALFYGHDNNFRHSRFNGIYGQWESKSKTAYTTVFNYKVFENHQNFQPKWEDAQTFNIMCDVAAGITVDTNNLELVRLIDENIIISESGALSPAFPVFTSTELKRFDEILQPLAKQVISVIDAVSDKAVSLIDDYVPRHLKQKARTIAKFDFSITAVGLFMDMLVERGILILPDSKTNLGIIGVTQ